MSKRAPGGTARHLPEVGDEMTIRVTVTRTDPNIYGGAVTFRIPGYGVPVTVQADHLLDDPGE